MRFQVFLVYALIALSTCADARVIYVPPLYTSMHYTGDAHMLETIMISVQTAPISEGVDPDLWPHAKQTDSIVIREMNICYPPLGGLRRYDPLNPLSTGCQSPGVQLFDRLVVNGSSTSDNPHYILEMTGDLEGGANLTVCPWSTFDEMPYMMRFVVEAFFEVHKHAHMLIPVNEDTQRPGLFAAYEDIYLYRPLEPLVPQQPSGGDSASSGSASSEGSADSSNLEGELDPASSEGSADSSNLEGELGSASSEDESKTPDELEIDTHEQAVAGSENGDSGSSLGKSSILVIAFASLGAAAVLLVIIVFAIVLPMRRRARIIAADPWLDEESTLDGGHGTNSSIDIDGSVRHSQLYPSTEIEKTEREIFNFGGFKFANKDKHLKFARMHDEIVSRTSMQRGWFFSSNSPGSGSDSMVEIQLSEMSDAHLSTREDDDQLSDMEI